MKERRDVREGVAVHLPLEGADEHGARGKEHEEDRVREERQRHDPGERKASPAGRDVRPECLGYCFDRDDYDPIFEGQSVAIFAFAALC